MDFVHKFLIALVGLLGAITLTVGNNIYARMSETHETIEKMDKTMIGFTYDVNYMDKDINKLNEKMKEHIKQSKAVLNSLKNRTHNGARR